MNNELSFSVDTGIFKSEVVVPFVKLGVQDDIISLICKKDEIIIVERDITNVSMIKCNMNQNLIENYENSLEDDEQVEISVDVNKLDTSLSNLSGKGKFVLDSKKQKLNISSGIYSYGIGLKTRQKRDRVFPNLEYENDLDIKGTDFFTLVDKCSKMNRFVALALKSDLLDTKNFVFYASASESDTNDTISVEFDKFNMIKNNIKSECSVFVDVINTDFLTVLKETVAKVSNVKLFMGDNYPIMLQYNIKENKGIMKMALAPRIPDN